MKKILFLLSAFLICQFINAQNSVGIGTTTPNTKALLDISSTTKGLLIPTMTSTQMNAIMSPPEGLIIYSSTQHELYNYKLGTWQPVNEYWIRPINNRSRIANASDSVGIGTNSPSEWLDVNGNIRSRNNMLADNNITATGNITGGQLSSTGNAVVVGTSLLNGDVTTNSDLIINNTAAVVQLKSSSVNKGFMQLSGDNLRIGTNSGNTTGKIVFRNDGIDIIDFDKITGNGSQLRMYHNGADAGRLYSNTSGDLNLNSASSHNLILNGDINITPGHRIGIGTIVPTEKLHVVGNCYVSGNFTADGNGTINGNLDVGGNANIATGRLTADVTTTAYNLLPVCYGRVSADGNKLGGTPNFAVEAVGSNGGYHITSSSITTSSIILLTARLSGSSGITSIIANYYGLQNGSVYINLVDDGGNFTNAIFNFIIFDP